MKDIIEKYLKQNNYDGLFVSGECACILEDLCPCGVSLDDLECEPGYLGPCPSGCGEHDWHIGAHKGPLIHDCPCNKCSTYATCHHEKEGCVNFARWVETIKCLEERDNAKDSDWV